jgi:hypothetical protein
MKYDEELVAAAVSLIARREGQRGKISDARIRRSISTSYYALYHFLIEEAATRLIGTHSTLLRRRRLLVRSFTHAGVKAALDKFSRAVVDQSVAEFVRPAGLASANVPSPQYAQDMAKAFSDAQAKRHDADYDLNKGLSERDAALLAARVTSAVGTWRAARTPADRDFKHAFCMLMLLKGKLREP